MRWERRLCVEQPSEEIVVLEREKVTEECRK
jgi:hypothetical protein